MKLYHNRRARSFRVLWMLEEMGLAYALESTPFPPGPELRVINPLGTLPTFVDGDLVMTESVAILEYLGRRYGPTPLAPQAASPTYGPYLEYLHFGEATLAAALNFLVRTRFLAPDDEKRNWTALSIAEVFTAKAAHLASVLKNRPYLAGEAFTAADISVTYALRFGANLGLSEAYAPEVKTYLETMQARPAFLRASDL